MKFRANYYSAQLKQEYRDLKDAKDMGVVGPELRNLINAFHTLTISTAECERSFSQMNLICRSMLSIEQMSARMFINISGPPLAQWCPLAYVKSWLGKQGRSDGGISVYIPPKSVYLNFLCGCFVSLTHLYPPKSNSWLRPCWQRPSHSD